MIMIHNVACVILLFINLINIESYRILGVFPFNGKSHDVIFNALMTGLVKRNHQVDVITHFPPEKQSPNYRTLINLNGTLTSRSKSFNIYDTKKTIDNIAFNYGNKVCELLGLEEMQKIIKNPPKHYDVIITEAFGANCFFGLGYIFKLPVVAIFSSIEYPWNSDYTGNYDNLAFVPSYFTENFDKSKFLHRLFNFVSHHWNKYEFYKIIEDVQTQQMRKYLNPDIPSIREVEKNISLFLINRNPIIDGNKPITTSMVEVSGLHLEESELPKIPEELQKWLDESKDGVVYFSFGSMVRIESSPDIIQEMYKSFAKIAPTRILMKIVNKSKLPPGLPQNVKILSWIPQQAVLAHENVRVFMTHGGLLSCQEALYYGVPIIGIPLFSDQPQNINKFSALNMAVKIDRNNLTTTSLDEALNAVLRNPKYRENAKFYSRLFKDRPMKAMDTAAFWIEYVIRNGNVLKSPTHEMSWWQLTLIDIYGFLLACLASIFALSCFVIIYVIYVIKKILLVQKSFLFWEIMKLKSQ